MLVVDDDAMSRELLSVLLEGEGYAVKAAESGEAALTLLRERGFTPDLILADVQMPGTTGAKLAGKLRRTCGEETMLLAMSGSRPAANTISRFDGFLLKPFKLAEIAAARSQWPVRAKSPAKPERGTVVPGPAPAGLSTQNPVSIHTPAVSAASKGAMDRQAPSAEPVVRTPVLNENIYRQLAVAMPAVQLKEMYTMCVDDARARIATMRRLADAHDGAKFIREAHAIKGGCGMLGATELHSMAAELEKIGLDAPDLGGGQQVNSLDELAAACDRLERILGSRV